MKDLKRVLTLAKDIGYGRTISILFLLLALVGVAGYFFGKSDSTTNISQVVNGSPSMAASAYKAVHETAESKPSCKINKFSEHEEDWLFTEFKDIDHDGFYCPKWSSGFSSPDMWYRNSINADFEEIRFVYKVKNKEDDNIESPSFIFSFGNSPRLMRLYIPEKTPQVIGNAFISLSSSTDELTRRDPDELRDPIKEDTQMELTVRSFVLRGNIVNYTYDISYISDQSGRKITDTFSKEVQIPLPNLSASTVSLGIGTLKENCVKPIEYEICK